MPIDVNKLREKKGNDPEIVRKSEAKRRANPGKIGGGGFGSSTNDDAWLFKKM